MEEIINNFSIALSDQTRALDLSITKWVVAGVAMVLGATMIFCVGFSSNNFLHGAAHDIRHTTGFPCH
jgi:cobalt transporter subunit CbtB